MANVVAVVKDDRVRRQIEQYLQDLGMEDLRFATFATVEEFNALYFRPKKKVAAPEPDAAAAGAGTTEGSAPPTDASGAAAASATPSAAPPADNLGDLKLFSEIHVVIFALDSINEKSGPWIDTLKRNMKNFKVWPESNQFHLVMLKYEEDGLSKVDLLHPLLDDIIYIPLDRLVFLQKMQILLGLPKLVKPSFLFNQEIKLDIEVSKLSRLDRLSDVGLAIRNPFPLKRGLPGHFYLNFPGEKTKLEVRAKVLRSDPHPEYPGQYLVYFTYFGISKVALSAIRKAISKSPRYMSLLRDDREAFRFKPNDPFLPEDQKRTFGVAIVDLDENLSRGLAATLSKDMDRLKVISESSYSLFLHKYFEPSTASGPAEIPLPTEESDFFRVPTVLTLSTSDMKCQAVMPTPVDGDMFLGHNAPDIFNKPERWLDLLSEKASRLILEESVGLAAKGRTADRLLVLTDIQGGRRAINFKFSRGSAENLVMATMTPANMGDIVTKLNSEERNKNLEVLILDSNFLPSEPQAWMDGMRARAVSVGLIQDPSALKFFILAENEAAVSPAWFHIPDILGLSIKPVDNRQLLFLLSELLPNKNTVYHFENLGWTQPGSTVHVAKEIHLEALSEYGASLRSAHKLVPGTVVYLRKSIFENAPNQCLAARVYSCEPHPSEKDQFKVLTTYFGINDAFLKFARTWIRENYASQKSHDN